MNLKNMTPETENNSASGVLFLRDLKFQVRLGVPDEERAKKQEVLVSIEIIFLENSEMYQSDNVEDSICYDSLIKDISRYLEDKSWKLLEKLTYDLYELIKARAIPNKVSVNVEKSPIVLDQKIHASFKFFDK